MNQSYAYDLFNCYAYCSLFAFHLLNVPTTSSTDTSTATNHSSTTVAPLDNTSSQPGGGDSSLSVILGTVIGVLVFMLLLMVGVVVCILTRRRFIDKCKPEVVSERQLVEGSQRGGISNGIHSAETGECVCLHNYLVVSNLLLLDCM